jgi:serine phosphatase RsbU (regulator of sigma subunit)
MGAGDTLLLFSDGVTEARSPAGDLFGVERLQAVLDLHADASAVELVREVRETVAEFARHGSLADDLTLLVVRRSGAPVPAAAGPDDDGGA